MGGRQKGSMPAVFCMLLADETAAMPQYFMENMFFCELFSSIWFHFEYHPEGFVYGSVHHLGDQKCSSDSQLCRYTDVHIKGSSAGLPSLCVHASLASVKADPGV